MDKQASSCSGQNPNRYIDIVLVEREARTLRAKHVAALFRSVAERIRQAVARRPQHALKHTSQPSPG